ENRQTSSFSIPIPLRLSGVSWVTSESRRRSRQEEWFIGANGRLQPLYKLVVVSRCAMGAQTAPCLTNGRSAHSDCVLSVFGNLVHRVSSEAIEQPGLHRTKTSSPVPDQVNRNKPIGEWIGIEAKLDEFAGSNLRKYKLPRQGRPAEARPSECSERFVGVGVPSLRRLKVLAGWKRT